MVSQNLPNGFEVVGPSNFHKYTAWMDRTQSDPTCRRFLSGNGWSDRLKEAPINDWVETYLISDRSLAFLRFDRSACLEISVGLYTLGENKKLATGRALQAILWTIHKYRYFRRVRSGCKACNVDSMELHRHIFGDPWGIEPEGVWDEVHGFGHQAHFSASVHDILRKFGHLQKRAA